MCIHEICIPPGNLLTIHVCLNRLLSIMYSFRVWKERKENVQRWIITCQIKHYFCVLHGSVAIQFRKHQDCQISLDGREGGERLNGKAPNDWQGKIAKIAFCTKTLTINYKNPSCELKIFQFRWIKTFKLSLRTVGGRAPVKRKRTSVVIDDDGFSWIFPTFLLP